MFPSFRFQSARQTDAHAPNSGVAGEVVLRATLQRDVRDRRGAGPHDGRIGAANARLGDLHMGTQARYVSERLPFVSLLARSIQTAASPAPSPADRRLRPAASARAW